MSGGASETELKAVAVIPRSVPSPARTVRTVTPEAKRLSAARKVVGSIGAIGVR